MTEYSGPLVDHNFTDDTWRGLFGDQPAVINDITGTAYALTLATDSNVATVGAEDQDSTSIVGGFLHRVPAGETHEIEIPPSTDQAAGRTDVIGVEYDPTITTEPGPCRLTRIAGVEGSTVVPTYAGPGAFLPLHEVTRKAGQGLGQATVRDRRVHRGPTLTQRSGLELPPRAAVGTVVRTGSIEWLRTLDTKGATTWTNRDSGKLLGTYLGNWNSLSPSGIYGAEIRVWGGNSAILATITLPDPGVPYRVEMYVSGFFGTETQNDGTRWDFDFLVGNTTIAMRVSAGENPHHGGYKVWSCLPSRDVFTGAQTASLRARRIYGAGYGAVNADTNKWIRASVYAA